MTASDPKKLRDTVILTDIIFVRFPTCMTKFPMWRCRWKFTRSVEWISEKWRQYWKLNWNANGATRSFTITWDSWEGSQRGKRRKCVMNSGRKNHPKNRTQWSRDWREKEINDSPPQWQNRKNGRSTKAVIILFCVFVCVNAVIFGWLCYSCSA